MAVSSGYVASQNKRSLRSVHVKYLTDLNNRNSGSHGRKKVLDYRCFIDYRYPLDY